jgi:hypothetical protein
MPNHSRTREGKSLHSEKRQLRRALELTVAGFSLANLCYVRIWSNLLTRHGPQSFSAGTRAIDLSAFLIGLCVTGVALTGLLWFAISRRRIVAVVGTAFVIAVACMPVNELRRLVIAPHFVTVLGVAAERLAHNAAGIGLLLVAAGLVAWAIVRFHAHVATVVVELALVISPLLLFSVGRTFWLLARGDVDPSFESVSDAAQARTGTGFDGRRVVFVVFDEMDFRLSFVERPAALTLPNFDALRRHSLFADSALPPASATLYSLPSYLTGQRVLTAKALGPGELELQFAGVRRPALWSKTSGFLNAIEGSGGHISLVGYRLPYCRVLRAVLSRCASWPLFGASGESSVLNIVFSQLKQIPPLGLHARWHELYELVASRSEREVADPRMDLVFLHAPAPHPPGIYDLQTHQFVLFETDYTRGYFGNLALADVFLGRLQRAIAAAGLAGSTTLIITSDHPWRESARFTGKSDARVPLLVQLAGVTTPVAYRGRVETFVAGELAAAVLKGEVKDTTGLVSWLQSHPSVE